MLMHSSIQACTNFVGTFFRVAWILKVYLLCYAHVIRKVLRISFIRVALWDRIPQPMNSIKEPRNMMISGTIRLAFGDYKTLGSSFSLSILNSSWSEDQYTWNQPFKLPQFKGHDRLD